MTLGAIALLIQYESLLAGVAGLVVAVALVAGSIVLSRAQHEAEAAVAVAWMGAVYAALGGADAGAARPGPPLRAADGAAGGAALAAGLVCVIGLGEGRTLAVPPVVVGAVFLGTGLLIKTADVDPAVVLTTALTLVVLAGSVFPWLALGVTGTRVDQLFVPADITADPTEVDPVRVGTDARVAHQILVAVSATVGLLLVLVAPLAVSLGLSGTLLAVVACLVVMLRTRQYRTGHEVLVGLASGILGLLAVGVSLLWMHPSWRPTPAVALAATGAVLLAVTLLPGTAVAAPGPARRPGRDLLPARAAAPAGAGDRHLLLDPGLTGVDGDQEGPRRGLLVQPTTTGDRVPLRGPRRARGRAGPARPHDRRGPGPRRPADRGCGHRLGARRAHRRGLEQAGPGGQPAGGRDLRHPQGARSTRR